MMDTLLLQVKNIAESVEGSTYNHFDYMSHINKPNLFYKDRLIEKNYISKK